MAKIQYNGCQSNTINIWKGVRQGCPLSLFNLVIELLVLSVKQNSAIHGVISAPKELKIVLYADYGFLVCLFSLQSPIVNSFVALKETIMLFTIVSSYLVNEQKMILLDIQGFNF